MYIHSCVLLVGRGKEGEREGGVEGGGEGKIK